MLVINTLLCTPGWIVNKCHQGDLGPSVQSISNPLQLGGTGKGFLGEAAFEKGFKVEKEVHK